jgi:hypothetical protein
MTRVNFQIIISWYLFNLGRLSEQFLFLPDLPSKSSDCSILSKSCNDRLGEMALREIALFYLWGCKETRSNVHHQRRTSRGPRLRPSSDSLLEANRTEDLVEVDWRLVLLSTNPSNHSSSISTAIDNRSYFYSF